MVRYAKYVVPVLALALSSGCSHSKKHDRSAQAPAAPAPGTPAPAVKGHEHHAPHSGTLVEFGEEFAHLELVLDAASGTLTAYVLDGEAEKTLRIAAPDLEIKAQLPGADGKLAETVLKLTAQADTLSGEKVGDTSVFKVQSDALKNAKTFDATVSAITVKGKDFKDTKFNFPRGNEEAKPAEPKK